MSNENLIPITPEIREAMQQHLNRERAELPSLRHISGDDCDHCGCAGSIRYLEECLRTGLMIDDAPEFGADELEAM